mmetsp:Transcript_93858/g.271293  ORF Transcript_93858/g.271293 Transcript_93858/m.271293 type:complete len:382 (-) Transcript_93858:115-1260(-)
MQRVDPRIVHLHDLLLAEFVGLVAGGRGMVQAEASPRAANCEVEDEVEALAERPPLAVEGARVEAVVLLTVDIPTDLLVLPNDGVGVPVADREAHLVELLRVLHVVVAAGVHRSVDRILRATHSLHNVDLAAVGPLAVLAVRREHPDRGPSALAPRHACAHLHTVPGTPLCEAVRRDLRRRKLLTVVVLTPRRNPQRPALHHRIVLRVVLQLLVAEAPAAMDKVPLRAVDGVPLKLVLPDEAQARGVGDGPAAGGLGAALAEEVGGPRKSVVATPSVLHIAIVAHLLPCAHTRAVGKLAVLGARPVLDLREHPATVGAASLLHVRHARASIVAEAAWRGDDGVLLDLEHEVVRLRGCGPTLAMAPGLRIARAGGVPVHHTA